MHNISYNLNKEAKSNVIFLNNDFVFENIFNFFSEEELSQIALFKKDFNSSKFVKIDLIKKNKKKNIILCKIDEKNFFEYDFQKLGGNVYNEVCNYENINILFESAKDLKKNLSLFTENFLIGFFSKTYSFQNYKLKKNTKTFFKKSIYQVLTVK